MCYRWQDQVGRTAKGPWWSLLLGNLGFWGRMGQNRLLIPFAKYYLDSICTMLCWEAIDLSTEWAGGSQ